MSFKPRLLLWALKHKNNEPQIETNKNDFLTIIFIVQSDIS